MINNKKVISIILARGGSKRLPNKNILSFVGKPLISWTIEAAKQSQYVDRIILSTDSKEIAEVAKIYGVDVPFMRPKKYATDIASSESVVLHVLHWIQENEGKQYDYVILLQPTSPLRTSRHIDEAVEKVLKNANADTLVSVTLMKKNPYWLQKIDKEGFLHGVFVKKEKKSEDLYLPNGALFIAETKRFLKQQRFYTKKTIAYIMESEVSIDIDEEANFLVAETLLQRLGNK